MRGLLVAALLLLGAFAIFGGWTGNYKAAMAAIKGKPATPAPPAPGPVDPTDGGQNPVFTT